MKKKLLYILVPIAILIVAAYLLIPNIVTLKSSATMNVTQEGLHRMLLQKESVQKWWPGLVNDSGFYLHGNKYTINKNNISLLPIVIDIPENKTITSTFYLISVDKNKINLEWVAKTITSYNPFKRVLAYFEAKGINKDMDDIMHQLQLYYKLDENIYSCKIKEVLVVDANLINTFGTTKGFPSIPYVYGLIDKLKNYATQQQVAITGYPMLNIEAIGADSFLTKVALPLEKVIPGNGKDIAQKQMLKDGNILVTEVTGGFNKTKIAFDAIVQYANDYGRNMPAIPFYSLITDRQKQPDSTKWITKIYCPVM